jgi:hypothetical protein
MGSKLDDEDLKVILSRVLKTVTLTIFFELYWDGTHGEPELNFDRINWQMFELLNSRRAIMISHERKLCQWLVMIPGRKLDTEGGFAFDDYPSLAAFILANILDKAG